MSRIITPDVATLTDEVDLDGDGRAKLIARVGDRNAVRVPLATR
jgi:hypothetical protein